MVGREELGIVDWRTDDVDDQIQDTYREQDESGNQEPGFGSARVGTIV